MGQSNALGQGSFHSEVTNPEYSANPDEVLIWDKLVRPTIYDPVDDGEFVPLTTGFGYSRPPGSNLDAIGCELQLAHRLRQQYDKPLFIIKLARGGTPLSFANHPVSWSPALSGNLWDLWRDYYFAPAMRILDLAGHTVSEMVMLWIHGAADSKREADANAYLRNLRMLVKSMRQISQRPDLRVVVHRETDITPPTGFPFLQLVREAQERYCDDDTNSHWYPTDGIDKHDGEHFSGNGQVEVGNRAATTIKMGW